MMGWSIVISQQAPTEWRAPDKAKNSIEFASWKASFGGLTWIEKLTKAGKISPLKDYSNTHLAFAEDILPLIRNGLPAHDDIPKENGSITPTGWSWDITIHRERIAMCSLSTILTISIFDIDY